MITDLTENDARYNVLRVVTHLSAPARPNEIFEIAVVDALVDDAGVHIGETQIRLFDPIGDAGDGGPGPCTPLHLAAAIWGGWTPDLLVSHDSASEAVLFGSSLTRGLPWLSLHRIARQVWPGRDSYELEALSASCADRRVRTSRPSGAAREAELTANLLSVVYADPGLRAVLSGCPTT